MKHLFILLLWGTSLAAFSQTRTIINHGQIGLLVNGDYITNNYYYPDKAFLARIDLMNKQILSLIARVAKTEKKIKKTENTLKKQSSSIDSLTAKLQSNVAMLQSAGSNVLDSTLLLKTVLNQYYSIADSAKAQGIEVPDTLYKDAVVTEKFFEGIQELRKDVKSHFDSDNKETYSIESIYQNSKFVVVGEYAENGLAVYKDKRKFGYTDRWLNKIIPPEYDFADKFRYGIAVVKRNRLDGYFYIDKNNKHLFNKKTFKGATGFFKEIGFVKINGKYLVKLKRAYVYDSKKLGWYMISKKGELLRYINRRRLETHIEPQLDSVIYSEQQKVFIGKRTDNNDVLLDINFNEVFTANKIYLFDSTGHYYSIDKGQHAIINKNGEYFIGPSKIQIVFDKNKMTLVRNDKGMELIDAYGKNHHSAIEIFGESEGIYPYRLDASLFNYYILSRDVVLDGTYSQVDSFHHGKAIVKDEKTNRFTIIDSLANSCFNFEPIFIAIQFDESKNIYRCTLEEKTFLFSLECKCVSDCEKFQELLKKRIAK